jgi:hypothetical protein
MRNHISSRGCGLDIIYTYTNINYYYLRPVLLELF